MAISMSRSPSSLSWTDKLILSNSNIGRPSVSAIAFKIKANPCIRCRFTAPRRGSSYRLFHTLLSGAPTSVPVRVAHELVQAGHHFLDVRSGEEFSAGHVHGAVNVSYLITLGLGMAKNSDFVAQVSSLFEKDDEIVIGCQTGKKSLMAVHELLSAGYTGILDMAGGYDAWIQGQLPELL